MIPGSPSPQYDDLLRDVLMRRDWVALREFSRTHNDIPDDVYALDQHFWEVLLHKLTCSRIDLLGLHEESKTWLVDHGCTMDLGGY
jgi:hypothetical protein